MKYADTFCISACGAMATQWLSKVLSASSRIQCFQGTDGLGKLHGAKTAEVPEIFDELAKVRAPFSGIVHLPNRHGVAGLEFCISNRIPFLALVRHPVTTVESQFSARQELMRGPLFDDVFKTLINKWSPEFGSDLRVSTFDRDELILLRCADLVSKHHMEVEYTGVKYFTFEEYTSNYSSLTQIVSYVTSGQLRDDHRIAEAFTNLGKQNIHRNRHSEYGPLEIFEAWSGVKKQIFRNCMRAYQRRILAALDNPSRSTPYDLIQFLDKSTDP